MSGEIKEIEEGCYARPRRYVFAATLVVIAALLVLPFVM
jgi:hypothetical protein